MSNIVIPNVYSNGQVIDAGQMNANFSAVTSVVNGGIDNTNLSSSLSITDNKLAQITSAAKVSGTALTGLASIPSGAGVIPSANLIYSNIQYPYVKVSETQSSGTGGQTVTSTGSWQTCILNTTDSDTQSISSLSGNQVTLPAGTYRIFARIPFVATNTSQSRLYNVTASSVLLTGSCAQANQTSVRCQADSIIQGIFTLSTSSAISIESQTATSSTGSSIGYAASFGTEVYTVAEFTKIA